MVGFGYKMGWLNLRGIAIEDVLRFFGIKEYKSISLDSGIEEVYSNLNKIIKIKDLIKHLSNICKEVQAFGTYRIIEYNHWIKAVNGKIERAFACIGESGEILIDEGEMTNIEKKYEWDKIYDMRWFPNGKNVIEVANAWSYNPLYIKDYIDNNKKRSILIINSREALK